MFRPLWMALMVVQFSFVYYLRELWTEVLRSPHFRDCHVDPAPPLTEESVLAYLRERSQKTTKPDLGAPVVYLEDEERTVSNQDCRIDHNSFSWIGAGVDGPVFSAEFDCVNRPRQTWALKLVAPRHNSTHGVIQIPGITPNKQQHLERQYHELIGGTLTQQQRDDVLRHFAIVVGTVRIPYSILQNQFRTLARTVPEKPIDYAMATTITTDPANTDIVAAVMLLLQGQPMGSIQAASDQHQFSIPQRRQIVRDFIHIFAHMHERNLVHCDIWLRHFKFTTPNDKVAVFDFDRRWILREDMIGANQMRKRQLLQLLNFIGIACNPIPRDSRRRIKYEDNVCFNEKFVPGKHPSPDRILRVLNPIFERCNNDLFPEADLLQFEAKELDQPAQVLAKLKRWVAFEH